MQVPPPPLEPAPRVEVRTRVEDGETLAFVVWRIDRPWTVASTASVGGGVGPRHWIINASVSQSYARWDLAEHIGALARDAGIDPAAPGVGLLTGANVAAGFDHADGEVTCRVSAGIRLPTWAAAPPESSYAAADEPHVGTINIVVFVPVPLDAGALLNAATTATEAKAQAMFDAGLPGTGTASDAVVVAAPPLVDGSPFERFGGPRSTWGSRVGRAVHAATTAGIAHSLRVIAAYGDADPLT
jgi:adenosylcobinamide amidohydrolase